MMLPPDYRDLWKGEFEVLKKEDVREGRAWMYEADPFAALREREEAKAEMEKKRADRIKAQEKAANSIPAPGAPGLALRGGPQSGAGSSGAHHLNRGWTKVPKIEMGKRTRTHVESLVRKHTIWNPNEVKLSQFQKHSIVNEFKNLEFRESHVQEAVEECKDREETLEWLLIHVPEDDLPRWALPEGYVAGISMGSSDLKKEAAIKRLAEAGYSLDLCKQIYSIHGDEGKAAEALQNILVSSGQDQDVADTDESWDAEDAKETSEAMWEEELSSLQSVAGDQFSRPSKDVCQIGIKAANRGTLAPVAPILQFRRSQEYPQRPPIISVLVSLPAYIRLSIMKQALQYATDNLLGEPMLYFLVDWVEQNLYSIVARPGRLSDISAAASVVSEVRPHHRKRQRVSRHPRPLDWTPNTRSKDEWMQRQSNPKLQTMISQRRTLPAWEMRETIIDTVNTHQVTIISGETGSGKSTQSAQFVLDDLYERALGGSAKIM